MKTFLILGVCLLFTVKLISSNVFIFEEEYKVDSRSLEGDGYAVCFCDGIRTTERFTEENMTAKLWTLSNPASCDDTCEALLKCDNCTGYLHNCFFYDEQKECYLRTFKIKPHPMLDSAYEMFREKHSSILRLNCSFPKQLKTAIVQCSEENDAVVCTQKCLFGYSLEDGPKRKLTCKYHENIFRPQGFEECKPTMDCNLRLATPGKLSCYPSGFRTPVACRLSCYNYSNHTAEPEEMYFCNKGGHWFPKLPFCVLRGAGESLTSALVHDYLSRHLSEDELNFYHVQFTQRDEF